MKQRMHQISYALNAILIVVIIVMALPEDEIPVDLTIYTQQDLSKAMSIKYGVSTQEIQKLLGIPVKKEISQNSEVWHYCSTGTHVDEYIAIEFKEGKVNQMSPYTVSYLDVIFKHTETPSKELIEASGLGDCRLMVGMGTYVK